MIHKTFVEFINYTKQPFTAKATIAIEQDGASKNNNQFSMKKSVTIRLEMETIVVHDNTWSGELHIIATMEGVGPPPPVDPHPNRVFKIDSLPFKQSFEFTIKPNTVTIPGIYKYEMHLMAQNQNRSSILSGMSTINVSFV